MKARPFLALVLVLTVLAFGLGLGGWWQVWQRSPLQLSQQPLTLPRAARFVPRLAPLSLYLFSDAEQPLAYARALAPPRQRRTAVDAVGRFRDAAFAAAGLDYPNELAGWLAPEIGLALFDTPEPTAGSADAGASGGGWLLALSSRDDQGARRFLQRFWQSRSLAGTDLQVSRYRGMGLISGRGALLGQEPVPLATALVDDDLVLIASGRGVLEQALDVSQIDELNQAAQPQLLAKVESLGSGAGLLLARPAAIQRWLGLSLPPSEQERSTLLLAALRPEGRTLRIRARLEGQALAQAGPGADAIQQGAMLAALRANPTSLALLQDPAALLQQPLLQPLLQRLTSFGASAGPLPALVAAADSGSLLLADGPQGWLLATTADRPDPAALEAALAAEGLIPAPLELRDRSVLVWTCLQAGTERSNQQSETVGDRLQASLAGWRSSSDGLAWWGGSLSLLDPPRQGGELQQRRTQLEALQSPEASMQWVMGSRPAQQLLESWQPWRLLSALAGGGLEGSLQGLGLALVPGDSAVQLQARLDFGAGPRR